MEGFIYNYLWFFLIYSVVGWTVEVAFIALTQGRFLNRGFLNGTVCPIYGFGMIGALMLLNPIADNLFVLFFGGMLLCSLVEFFGGWALDKLFNMRWWDYTDKPFNIKGYVCLGYSVMWGIGVVLAIRVVHPLFAGIIARVPVKLGVIPLAICYLVYAADFAVTLKTMIGIRKSLGELERIAEGLHQLGDEMSALVGNVVTDTSEAVGKGMANVSELTEKGMANISELTEKGMANISELTEKGMANVSELTEKSKAEWNEFAEKSKAEWDEFTEKGKAELMERKEQLEERSAALLKRMSKARILKAFPGVRRSKSSVRLSEELKKMKEKYYR